MLRAERCDRNLQGLDVGLRVDVDEPLRIELDDSRVEFCEGVAQGELARIEPALEHREHAGADRTRERTRLRDRDVAGRFGEAAKIGPAHEWHVDGQDDGKVRVSGPQPGDDPGKGRAGLGSIVDDREWKLESVRPLADCDALVADVAENPPSPCGERLAVEWYERLGRAKPAARAADEQDPRQTSRRHGSL